MEKHMNTLIEAASAVLNEEKQFLTEATRWNVGIELPNGKVLATYGHYDGDPDYVGKILKKHYSNPAKLKQLLKLGKQGISSLDKDIEGGKDHSFSDPVKGQTVFYGRDRGQKTDMSATYKNKEEFRKRFGQDFGYLYSMKDKKWTYFKYGSGIEKSL